jgi:uncharacterized alpha-E superfamily protein
MLQAIHFGLHQEEDSANEYAAMMAVLKSVNGYESYRQEYMELLSMETVVEFMVLHPTFPRSTIFALDALERHVRQLVVPEQTRPFFHNKVLSHVNRVRAEIRCVEKSEFSIERLAPHLHAWIIGCDEIGWLMERHFFLDEVVVSA